MMKAIEITQPGVITVAEHAVPFPADGEVLLKINYVGFCGSDLTTFLGKNRMVQYPRIPGHEISAVIEATGSNVPEKFRKGSRVTVIPYTHCGECSSCRQRRFNACRYNQTLGVQRDGAMAEYIVQPWQKLIVEDALTELQLALVEPLTVGFHAVGNARVTDSDTVMVLGCGMIGMGAVIRAHLRGATVIAVDVDDSKLETAGKLGADYLINTTKQELSEATQITGGHGPSVVVEAAGHPQTYRSAFENVAFAGRVVCIGYAKEDVALATHLWVQKELQIMGSRNADPADFDAVVNYIKKTNINPELLVSEVVPVENACDAMQRWSENPGKILKIMVKF